MPGLCPELSIQYVCCVRDNRRTVPQDSSVDAMASGDSRPGGDRSGVSFRVLVQVLWNDPESVVTCREWRHWTHHLFWIFWV